MMKINKIQNTNLNLKVRGQGCVYYDTAYTPKTTTWW